MKKLQAGYIKLHRKFLDSHVHKLGSAAVCLFIDLLLLADQDGEIETSYSALQRVVNIRCHKTVLAALTQLKQAQAIDFSVRPNLFIKLINWGGYQAKQGMGKIPTNCGKNSHSAMGKSPIVYGKNSHSAIIRYPLDINNNINNSLYKNNKNFLYKEKFLDFNSPKTDLEKLILFYLKGTKHPALKKPDNNELLNAAVKNDVPHFQTILANCDNLQQAKKCVQKYVQEANGKYSMFYLAGMINSVRQEIESRENKQ